MEISTTSIAGAPGIVPTQPALANFELPGSTASVAVPSIAHPFATAAERAERRTPRHRYWSLRDLSRRIWVGRGYELLRGLIRAGIVPATRSARSWWIDDADVEGLLAAFEDRAGKVRAFHGLDEWLRERCYVAPRTAETEAALANGHRGFAWRGNVYLPKRTWRVDFAPDGRVTYFHESGTTIPPMELAAAA